MLRRKHVAVLVFRRRRPAPVLRRNLRRGVKRLAIRRRVVVSQDLPQQPIALAFAVSPGAVEKIAAQINRELQRRNRLAVIRPAPSAHPPKPVGNVANFQSSASKFAIDHVGSLREDFRIDCKGPAGSCAYVCRLTTCSSINISPVLPCSRPCRLSFSVNRHSKVSL